MPQKEQRVVIYVVHHKTERNSHPIKIVLPKGLLSDMLVWWINTGWQIIKNGKNSPALFKSSYGFAFTDCTFTQYWKKIMKSAPPSLPYFPPNMARTSFVESYTASELCVVKYMIGLNLTVMLPCRHGPICMGWCSN